MKGGIRGLHTGIEPKAQRNPEAHRPMTVTIEGIFDWIGKAVDAGKVCPSCRDRTLCEKCVFNKSGQTIRAT
jgi:hypothetical protein